MTSEIVVATDAPLAMLQYAFFLTPLLRYVFTSSWLLCILLFQASAVSPQPHPSDSKLEGEVEQLKKNEVS